MLKHTILAATFAIALFSALGNARADAIAWDKILGVKQNKLSAEQKTRIAKNLNRINNTRGCQGTLANCLAKGDMTARRHAGFVARMVRKNKDDKTIEQGVKARAESAFPEEIFNIDLTDHPHKGNPKAKVVIVEYACFECPFCAHLAPRLKNLSKKFGDKIVHYYKFYPVRSHKRGVPSALAGLAAHRQGKFWQMHDFMYRNRADLSDDDLTNYAQKSGLDIVQFKAAIKDTKAMRQIERDKLEGMRFGIEGTPTFFINGKMFIGQQDYEEILDRIAEEIDIIEDRIK